MINLISCNNKEAKDASCKDCERAVAIIGLTMVLCIITVFSVIIYYSTK